MDLIQHPSIAGIDLDRGDGRNSLDEFAIAAMDTALTKAEANPACRIFTITSGAGVFSTGMDLAAASRQQPDATSEPGGSFFDLLQRLTSTPLLVVAVVDGKVAGGGVGIVAASDLVLASPSSTFALPEALWGLLPCVVLPFLTRRIGVQRAHRMTVTTQSIDAATAREWGLADEVTDDANALLRPLAFRASKIDRATTEQAKRYTASLAPITAQARERAVTQLDQLMSSAPVRERLAAFAGGGRLPWQG